MKGVMRHIARQIYDEGSVGWGLWALLFVLFAWPGVALVLSFTYDVTPYPARVASGVFVGAMFAAMVTWLVNDILFRLVVKPRYRAGEAERKKEKKKGKKKGKRK